MRIEIAEHVRMSESGSSLLRLIQNNETCRLDLLVREAVQNSLDAADDTIEDKPSIKVDFETGVFKTNEVSDYFEDISVQLNTRYPGKQAYIAVRDSNTVGLTGPVRYEDVKNGNFGNLLKLVYEICKPQDQEGAGGSWGLGKTVYFRIGIGLVIYYSRIKNKRGYESRLAAALVEDEKKRNHLLPRRSGKIPRGIAWWGAVDLKDPKRTRTIPVTNEREIETFLKKLNITPYKGAETGTTIIIPFINTTELLEETKPVDVEEGANTITPYWCNSIAEYIKTSVQRWYAPRISNSKYKEYNDAKYLEVSINNEKLTKSGMAPIFKLIQTLYNAEPDVESKFGKTVINSKPITIQKTFEKSLVGWINYVKVTSDDLGMGRGSNKYNPYYYINRLNFETMYNDPIITFIRKPGMIVSYSITGDWTDNIPKTEIGEYIVGIFIPNSDNQLLQKEMTLEEYLRGSEKADHMNWEDWTVDGKNLRIIERIRKAVRRKIREDFSNLVPGEDEKKNYGLGTMLAGILLPPAGYGNGPVPPGPPPRPPKPPVRLGTHVAFEQIGESLYSNNTVTMPVRLEFKKRKEILLEMYVDTERGAISSSDWENSIETEFPVAIKSFVITKIANCKKKGEEILFKRDFAVNDQPVSVLKNSLSFSFGKTEKYGVRDKIRISYNEQRHICVEGNLSYSLRDVAGSIILKGVS